MNQEQMSITIPDPQCLGDVPLWRARKTAIALLKADLVPSDSHDEVGAMMTTDKAWYFIPCLDDYVMSRPTLNKPSRPTDRPKWRVEVVKCFPGGHMEPDDYDLEEVGDRSDSLINAVEEARRTDLENEIQGHGDGIYWEADMWVNKFLPFDVHRM
jgi:hypothetical protein